MVIDTKFEANLNADKIYMDMTYLPDPIKNKFWLTIRNQSLVILYFKIICNITNWSMDTPADGKLGSVGAATIETFTPIITRAKPGAEATDSGNFTIEAYTDAAYTVKIGEDSLDVTVYIEDLENWTDVAKSDFDDGTAQTWTLAGNMTISNTASVEVGGYSARFYRAGFVSQVVYLEKSISLPNRNKVRVSFFLAYELSGTATYPAFVRNLSFKVDGVKVFDIPFTVRATVGLEIVREGWFKFTADLSAYKGQTKTIRIEDEAGVVPSAPRHVTQWFDRIVIAGED